MCTWPRTWPLAGSVWAAAATLSTRLAQAFNQLVRVSIGKGYRVRKLGCFRFKEGNRTAWLRPFFGLHCV